MAITMTVTMTTDTEEEQRGEKLVEDEEFEQS